MNARELKMTPEEFAREQERQRKARKARASRVKAKSRPNGKTAEERRAERTARVAAIRAAVMERAAGRCELCKREGMVLEMEHVISGGLRRHREAKETCIALCADCHRARHRGEEPVLRAEYEWALRNGFREAAKAVAKRLDKLAEARAFLYPAKVTP